MAYLKRKGSAKDAELNNANVTWVLCLFTFSYF